MRLKLLSDALLTVGSGSHPVDLVSKSSGARVGLSEDEAAVAMLLAEGVPSGDGLTKLVQSHGVAWDAPTLKGLLGKLRGAGLLIELPDGVAPRSRRRQKSDTVEAPTEGYEVKDTDVDVALRVLAEASGEHLEPEEVEELDEEDVQEVVEPLELAFRVDVEVEPLAEGVAQITDARTGAKLRIGQDVLKVALLFDGKRSLNDIVEAAALEGISVGEEMVRALGHQLQERGLLAPPEAVSQQLPRLKALPTLSMAKVTEESVARRAAQARPRPPVPEPSVDTAILATALVLLRDRRYAEAKQALDPVVQRNPQNAQAQALLQLVATEVQRSERARRRERMVRLLVFGGIGLVAITAMLVPVPEQRDVPCALHPLPAGQIVGPSFAAKVKELRTSKDALVKAGEVVAVVSDEEAAEKLQPLRAAIENDRDLLRIMRTGGTDDDASKSRRAVQQLTDHLEELGRCARDDAKCIAERKRLTSSLANARAKYKYCEWKAFPEEIVAIEQRLKKELDEEAALKRRLLIELRSPASGVISELSGSRKLAPGAQLARLIHESRFAVEIATSKLPEGDSAIEITQRKGAVIQTFYGAANKAVKQGGKLRVELAADTRKVSFSGSCQAKLSAGRTMLGVALWRKVAGR